MFLKVTYAKDDGRAPVFVEVDTSPADPFGETTQFTTRPSSATIVGPGRSSDGSRLASEHTTEVDLAGAVKVELVDDLPAEKPARKGEEATV